MNMLSVDQTACQQCGICVEICPLSLISLNSEGFPASANESESLCVKCGHCEAVCTTGALKNNLLPELQVISKEKIQQINPENLSEYFRSRRSIRKFLPEPVEKSKLEQLFEVVTYSPTGINHQQNKWIMMCDKGKIRQLSDAVIDWMKAMVEAKSELAQYLGFENLIGEYERNNDVICRSAPNLIIGYTDASYTGGMLDSVIATSHLELLLPSFGLGGCWAGFVMIALGYSPEVRKIVGLNETHTVRSALMVGYPKYHFSKMPYRNEATVKWM
jgi:nitroreductase/NAD-dependent dihydropyrimidine dehydrogenase PreA subunit